MTEYRSRSRGRPSRENKPADLKNEIIIAALETFGEKGFEGASLSMIARRAGADTGLIRYYFGSKSALWETALTWLVSVLGQELQDHLSNMPTNNTAQLKEAIRWFIKMSANRPWLARIIVFESSHGNERADFIAENVVGPAFSLMKDLIGKAIAEGLIVNVEPRTIFFMITHGGSFPMSMPELTNSFPGGDIRDPQVLEEHAESIIRLLLGGA